MNDNDSIGVDSGDLFDQRATLEEKVHVVPIPECPINSSDERVLSTKSSFVRT